MKIGHGPVRKTVDITLTDLTKEDLATFGKILRQGSSSSVSTDVGDMSIILESAIRKATRSLEEGRAAVGPANIDKGQRDSGPKNTEQYAD